MPVPSMPNTDDLQASDSGGEGVSLVPTPPAEKPPAALLAIFLADGHRITSITPPRMTAVRDNNPKPNPIPI